MHQHDHLRVLGVQVIAARLTGHNGGHVHGVDALGHHVLRQDGIGHIK